MIAILSAVLLYVLGVNMGLDSYAKYMNDAVENAPGPPESGVSEETIGKLGLWLMALLWPLVELREIYERLLNLGTKKEG